VRTGIALRRRYRIHRRDCAFRATLFRSLRHNIPGRDDDHWQPDRRQRGLRELYPARMRTTGIGWALGIGRLGGIVAPVLGGYLLAVGLPPTHIFLVAGLFALIAAAATSLLVFRNTRVESVSEGLQY
jgi:hypothetical protein